MLIPSRLDASDVYQVWYMYDGDGVVALVFIGLLVFCSRVFSASESLSFLLRESFERLVGDSHL